MGTRQNAFRLTIILAIMLSVESCNASTPIPTWTSTVPLSTPLPTDTQIPASSTPAPPTLTSTPNITSTPNPTLVAIFISGLWEGSNGSYYLFHADGTWNWDEHPERVENTPENTGKWWIRGNTFYIQDLTGKAKCPANQIGGYEPSFENGKLKLIVISDKCDVRVPQTQGIYTLLP